MQNYVYYVCNELADVVHKYKAPRYTRECTTIEAITKLNLKKLRINWRDCKPISLQVETKNVEMNMNVQYRLPYSEAATFQNKILNKTRIEETLNEIRPSVLHDYQTFKGCRDL